MSHDAHDPRSPRSPRSPHSPHIPHATHAPSGPPGDHWSAGTDSSPAAVSRSVADLVRWAAFSCLLVPLVLLGYGAPPGGAALAAVGLGGVTAVCRFLLRRSERLAARAAAEELQTGTHRGRHSRTGSGAHRGGR
ncbi:hypothetical protein [Streptomyces cremeus]|uniref:Uncharacterized protein n=1 Tax=Streptomyces cremeus TaxID=66881 RepID=A0ABV5PHN4_STRCM